MGALADAWTEIKKQSAVKDQEITTLQGQVTTTKAQVDQLVAQNAQLSQELENGNAGGLDDADKAALAEMVKAAGITPQ